MAEAFFELAVTSRSSLNQGHEATLTNAQGKETIAIVFTEYYRGVGLSCLSPRGNKTLDCAIRESG